MTSFVIVEIVNPACPLVWQVVAAMLKSDQKAKVLKIFTASTIETCRLAVNLHTDAVRRSAVLRVQYREYNAELALTEFQIAQLFFDTKTT